MSAVAGQPGKNGGTCQACGVYLTAHGRSCPVTVVCPHCLATPGVRCRKPNGRPMDIGSHARRVRAASDG